MPLDISKSHTKTQINLSKPYHQGPLLIDLKSRSSKTLIDIKPIRKSEVVPNSLLDAANYTKQSNTKAIIESQEKDFSGDVKAPTLDFDKLDEFDDLQNPFAQSVIKDIARDAKDVQIKTQVGDKSAMSEATTYSNQNKQLGDIKKVDINPSGLSFSSLKPKINVAPLHSRSRILVAIDQNRTLTKENRKKRSLDQNPATDHKTDLENFKTNLGVANFEDINNHNFFQFKAPPKFDSNDIPQFANHSNHYEAVDESLDKASAQVINKESCISQTGKKIRRSNKLRRYSASTLFTTIIIIFCTLFLTGNAQWMGKFGEKNAQADKTKSTKNISYDKWIADNNFGNYAAPGEDLDKDSINNYEEFLIGSNPSNKNSCNVNVTDNENLLNLIDPVSCLPIDFNVPNQVLRFKEVLNITPEFIQKHQDHKIRNQSFQASSVQANTSIISVSQSSAAVVTDILPIPNIETTITNTPTFIEASAEIKNLKLPSKEPMEKTTLEQVSKSQDTKILEPIQTQTSVPASNVNTSLVQQYIDQYRSYDKYDNQAANPVGADYFIDMAKRYSVPLKYVLAVARSESRFGTDQFNQDGSANRIGRHLNMYSIGLDDAGGSLTYPSWEAGVDAFGRWYTKFENKGYSDCAKWRIYNPNGDYCQKIENLAGQIETFINN